MFFSELIGQAVHYLGAEFTVGDAVFDACGTKIDQIILFDEDGEYALPRSAIKKWEPLIFSEETAPATPLLRNNPILQELVTESGKTLGQIRDFELKNGTVKSILLSKKLCVGRGKILSDGVKAVYIPIKKEVKADVPKPEATESIAEADAAEPATESDAPVISPASPGEPTEGVPKNTTGESVFADVITESEAAEVAPENLPPPDIVEPEVAAVDSDIIESETAEAEEVEVESDTAEAAPEAETEAPEIWPAPATEASEEIVGAFLSNIIENGENRIIEKLAEVTEMEMKVAAQENADVALPYTAHIDKLAQEQIEEEAQESTPKIIDAGALREAQQIAPQDPRTVVHPKRVMSDYSFLVGRTVQADIRLSESTVLRAGEPVTDAVIDLAFRAGKLFDLTVKSR